MAKTIVIILVSIFIGVAFFSFSQAISLFRSRESLRFDIDNIYTPKIAKLEEENIRINKDLVQTQNSLTAVENENMSIKQELEIKDDNLRKFKTDLQEKEKAFDEIKNKYTELIDENNLLKEKITSMFLELKKMRDTLSSVGALKEKIGSLKKSGLKKKKKINKSKPQLPSDLTLYGNRGYLIKDGKTTYVPKVKIQVRPVED